MDKLISDSVSFIEQYPDIEDTIRKWQIDSNGINYYITSKKLSLHYRYLDTCSNLYQMIEYVTTTNDIIVYKGLDKKTEDETYEFIGFTSTTSDLEIAKEFMGKDGSVMKILIPKNTYAFYISAIDIINNNSEDQQEKEILLLPGTFTFDKNLWIYKNTINHNDFINLQNIQ